MYDDHNDYLQHLLLCSLLHVHTKSAASFAMYFSAVYIMLLLSYKPSSLFALKICLHQPSVKKSWKCHCSLLLESYWLCTVSHGVFVCYEDSWLCLVADTSFSLLTSFLFLLLPPWQILPFLFVFFFHQSLFLFQVFIVVMFIYIFEWQIWIWETQA